MVRVFHPSFLTVLVAFLLPIATTLFAFMPVTVTATAHHWESPLQKLTQHFCLSQKLCFHQTQQDQERSNSKLITTTGEFCRDILPDNLTTHFYKSCSHGKEQGAACLQQMHQAILNSVLDASVQLCLLHYQLSSHSQQTTSSEKLRETITQLSLTLQRLPYFNNGVAGDLKSLFITATAGQKAAPALLQLVDLGTWEYLGPFPYGKTEYDGDPTHIDFLLHSRNIVKGEEEKQSIFDAASDSLSQLPPIGQQHRLWQQYQRQKQYLSLFIASTSEKISKTQKLFKEKFMLNLQKAWRKFFAPQSELQSTNSPLGPYVEWKQIPETKNLVKNNKKGTVAVEMVNDDIFFQREKKQQSSGGKSSPPVSFQLNHQQETQPFIQALGSMGVMEFLGYATSSYLLCPPTPSFSEQGNAWKGEWVLNIEAKGVHSIFYEYHHYQDDDDGQREGKRSSKIEVGFLAADLYHKGYKFSMRFCDVEKDEKDAEKEENSSKTMMMCCSLLKIFIRLRGVGQAAISDFKIVPQYVFHAREKYGNGEDHSSQQKVVSHSHLWQVQPPMFLPDLLVVRRDVQMEFMCFLSSPHSSSSSRHYCQSAEDVRTTTHFFGERFQVEGSWIPVPFHFIANAATLKPTEEKGEEKEHDDGESSFVLSGIRVEVTGTMQDVFCVNEQCFPTQTEKLKDDGSLDVEATEKDELSTDVEYHIYHDTLQRMQRANHFFTREIVHVGQVKPLRVFLGFRRQLNEMVDDDGKHQKRDVCKGKSSISLTIQFTIDGDAMKKKKTLPLTFRCRDFSTETFTTTFLDRDGSVSIAAMKAPLMNSATLTPEDKSSNDPDEESLGDSHQSKKCNFYPIVISLHGTGVGCSNQADSFKRQATIEEKKLGLNRGEYVFGVENAWLVAPDRYGAHNWETVGKYTALTAIFHLYRTALALSHPTAAMGGDPQEMETNTKRRRPFWWSLCQILADKNRVLSSGHSMGGHGALHLSTQNPDRMIGAMFLAAWISKEHYGDANTIFRLDHSTAKTDSRLKGILEASVRENDPDMLLVNILHIPVLIRVGVKDMTVSVYYSRRLFRLLKEEGHAMLSYEEVANKEHWWWDTSTPNDGGCMNDKKIRNFLKSVLRQHPPKRVKIYDRRQQEKWRHRMMLRCHMADAFLETPSGLLRTQFSSIAPSVTSCKSGMCILEQITPQTLSTFQAEVEWFNELDHHHDGQPKRYKIFLTTQNIRLLAVHRMELFQHIVRALRRTKVSSDEMQGSILCGEDEDGDGERNDGLKWDSPVDLYSQASSRGEPILVCSLHHSTHPGDSAPLICPKFFHLKFFSSGNDDHHVAIEMKAGTTHPFSSPLSLFYPIHKPVSTFRAYAERPFEFRLPSVCRKHHHHSHKKHISSMQHCNLLRNTAVYLANLNFVAYDTSSLIRYFSGNDDKNAMHKGVMDFSSTSANIVDLQISSRSQEDTSLASRGSKKRQGENCKESTLDTMTDCSQTSSEAVNTEQNRDKASCSNKNIIPKRSDALSSFAEASVITKASSVPCSIHVASSTSTTVFTLYATDPFAWYHLILDIGQPTVPPMMRAPFGNMLPMFFRSSTQQSAKGYGSFLAAGYYRDDGGGERRSVERNVLQCNGITMGGPQPRRQFLRPEWTRE